MVPRSTRVILKSEMRSQNFSDHLLREHRDWIRSEGVRAVFDVLSEHAQSLPGYRCEPRLKGVVRDFRYYTEGGVEQPFAFIVNQSSLLFYIRLPGLERLPGGRVALEAACGPVSENKRGELQVRLQSRSEATALIQHLFCEKRPVSDLPLRHTIPAVRSKAVESAVPQTTGGELTELFEWAVSEIEKAYAR